MNLKKDGGILYVSSIDISLSRGSSVNEREFIIQLGKEYGKSISFIVPEPMQSIEDIHGLELIFSSPHHQHNPISFWKHQLSQIREADKLLSTKPVQFIIFRLDILPLAQIYIARRYKIPYVIKTLGEGILNVFNRQGVIGNLASKINDRLLKMMTRNSIAIDVCTKELVDYTSDRLSIHSDKIYWIDNATNTQRFRPMDKVEARARCSLTSFGPIIGFVGGKPWERGGAQMIEITPRLLEQYPNLGVVIVGGGSGMAKLKERAANLNVTKHCVFPGLVPYKRVPDFINAFDVGISFDRAERLELIGNSSQKIRQYIACGKPVVSGRGGNLFIEREKLGTIVEVDDLAQVFNALNKWLSLTEQEKNLHSKKASTFAQKNLSVEKVLNERLEIWNNRLSK